MQRIRRPLHTHLPAAAIVCLLACLPASAATHASPCLDPAPTHAAADSKVYLKDLEFLLDTIERDARHLLKQKGIDWKKVRKEILKQGKSLKSDADLLDLVQKLMGRTHDGHASITDISFEYPKDRQRPEQKGVGLSLAILGKKVLVKDCYGPAEAAGLSPGWEITHINDKRALDWLKERAESMRDLKGYSTEQAALYGACHRGMADARGFRFAMKLKKPKGGTKSLTLTCASGGGNGVPFGPLKVPEGSKRLGRHTYGKTASGLGYIHLRKIEGDLPAQLDQMLGSMGDVPGLILDFRSNTGGGTDHDAVFSRFLKAGEDFAGRSGQQDGAHYSKPLVIIIDAGAASAAETVSGMLGVSGRGYVIGPTPSAGMSGSKKTVTTPSGLVTVRFTVRSYKANGSSGPEIEGHGIQPHQIVDYEPKLMLQGLDPLIHAAEQLLQEGLPEKVVKYQSP